MFGKKNSAPNKVLPDISIATIPVEFYAGKNPVIHFATVDKEVSFPKNFPATTLSRQDKKLVDQLAAPGHKQPLHPVSLLSSRRFLIISALLLFIIFSSAAGWFYWREAALPRRPIPILVTVPAISTTPSAASSIVPEIVVIAATNTAISLPPVPSLQDTAIDFPSLLLANSADSDRDDLTGPEEELYQTDPEISDSDSDKYADGHEIYNLYNPIGKEPLKIIDSGLIKDFTNPVFDYKIYYPVSWAVGNVDQNYRDVLFSTLTRENIELLVLDHTPGQTFSDWFNNWARAERFEDLIPFTSVFKETGYRRRDYLTYYFMDKTHVYALLYHPATDSGIINYRAVAKMMARSFRLVNNTTIISAPAEEGVRPEPLSSTVSNTIPASTTVVSSSERAST